MPVVRFLVRFNGKAITKALCDRDKAYLATRKAVKILFKGLILLTRDIRI